MDITLRQATEDDIVSIIRLSKATIKKAYGNFIPIDAIQPWLAEGGESDKYIINSIPRMQVAVAEGQVVGCVVIEDNLIDAMVVDVTYWGKNVGSTLLEWAEGRLMDAGHEKAQLECFEPNIRAVEFYKTKGYRIRDTIMDAQAGVRKLLLEKNID